MTIQETNSKISHSYNLREKEETKISNWTRAEVQKARQCPRLSCSSQFHSTTEKTKNTSIPPQADLTQDKSIDFNVSFDELNDSGLEKLNDSELSELNNSNLSELENIEPSNNNNIESLNDSEFSEINNSNLSDLEDMAPSNNNNIDSSSESDITSFVFDLTDLNTNDDEYVEKEKKADILKNLRSTTERNDKQRLQNIGLAKQKIEQMNTYKKTRHIGNRAQKKTV